jgi:toxin-antitoxin system PIN domain toxin
MISFDTNLLLYSINRDSPEQKSAKAFFDSLPDEPGSVGICELVLTELYVLLRNPKIFPNPLTAEEAVSVIQSFRKHPKWTLLDVPGGRSLLMDQVWNAASNNSFGRRVIFDARLAFTLRYHGVTDFATRNEGHFLNFGFKRVWNPIEDVH